jgi:hypothetical protein
VIKTTSEKTLAKYGLTIQYFKQIIGRQGGVCGICKKEPSSGRLNIDHEHIKGWKKLPPDERRKYVRGALCYVCNNRIMTKGITIEKLKNAIEYLDDYKFRGWPSYNESIKREKLREE